MEVLLNTQSTPFLIFIVILLSGLMIAVRGIIKWRRQGTGIDWSTSVTDEDEKPNYMPVAKQGNLLQQQKIITTPPNLTPENMRLETTDYNSLKEAKHVAEALFIHGGFYRTDNRGENLFLGPYGEVFRVSCDEETAIIIDYADDFNLANLNNFGLFARYPITLGQELLPKIAEDLLDYAENA